MPTFFVRTAPAAWASYFVNGDASGITDTERAQADAWLAREKVRVIDVAEGAEAYFSRSVQWYAPEVDYSAGDLLEYTCERYAYA